MIEGTTIKMGEKMSCKNLTCPPATQCQIEVSNREREGRTPSSLENTEENGCWEEYISIKAARDGEGQRGLFAVRPTIKGKKSRRGRPQR